MRVIKGKRGNGSKHWFWGIVENDVFCYFDREHQRVNYRLAGYERLLKERNELEVELKVLRGMYDDLVDRIENEGVILLLHG